MTSLGIQSKIYQKNSLHLDLEVIHSRVPRYNPQVKFKIWKEQSWYIASRMTVPQSQQRTVTFIWKALKTFHANLSSMLACPLLPHFNSLVR